MNCRSHFGSRMLAIRARREPTSQRQRGGRRVRASSFCFIFLLALLNLQFLSAQWAAERPTAKAKENEARTSPTGPAASAVLSKTSLSGRPASSAKRKKAAGSRAEEARAKGAQPKAQPKATSRRRSGSSRPRSRSLRLKEPPALELAKWTPTRWTTTIASSTSSTQR